MNLLFASFGFFQLDNELAELDRIESRPGDHDDELERIRSRRLAEMKRTRDQLDEWRARGHGALVEVPLGDARAEKAFFDEARGSHHLVRIHILEYSYISLTLSFFGSFVLEAAPKFHNYYIYFTQRIKLSFRERRWPSSTRTCPTRQRANSSARI